MIQINTEISRIFLAIQINTEVWKHMHISILHLIIGKQYDIKFCVTATTTL
jgi:hypothetical protein